MYIFIDLNIYLSVYLYVCLPVYLSVISFLLPEWWINVYISLGEENIPDVFIEAWYAARQCTE